MFMGIAAPPPAKRRLRHWEHVCRFLDAQPYRAVAYPFPDEPPMSARLFRRMARFRLVRHRDDCRWQLSPRWQAILLRLWEGVVEGEVSTELTEEVDLNEPQPFVAAANVDTAYVNLFAERLPERLLAACAELKARAQEEDDTVETPWIFFEAPLSMLKAGVGTSAKRRGVSWSYILRNAMVMLLLRKAPLNGLAGSVRLSAECLWTYGPRGALDGMRDGLRALWCWAQARGFAAVTFQLSQIHLCADVVHFVPQPADLSRLVTRSLKKAVHIPSVEEEQAAWMAGEVGALVVDEPWLVEMVPEEWADISHELYEEQAEAEWGADDEEEGLSWADEAGAAVHLWGQRASGFAFSPGGDLSAVWYDKVLEERRSGKRWMEPIHRAGGWDGQAPVTRVEVRFRRSILRELAGMQSEEGRWFDDPWRCLEHLGDLWAYFAGLPPEADTAPDMTHRGWMRLTVPDVRDTNRSRWATDAVWQVIQRAQFGNRLPAALRRLPRGTHDLEQVDAELYGLLKLRGALRGEYLDTTVTLSLELRAFAKRMEEVDEEKGRDFADEVREKARQLGRPVPICGQGLLRCNGRPG